MRAIFISYRRDDAEGQAGRLSDDLGRHFGKEAVFMDVSAIKPGLDFRRVIDEHVSTCGVLLTVIGKSWLTTTNEAGTRRLDDPLDFVRLETGAALKRDIPVVPVLVHGAKMPRAEDLPDDLKELAFRNGVELTHQRWDSDVEVLVKALRPYVQAAQPSAAAAAPAVSATPAAAAAGSPAKAIAIGVGGVVVAGAALLAWQRLAAPTPPPMQTAKQQLTPPASAALQASQAAAPAATSPLQVKPAQTTTATGAAAPAKSATPSKPTAAKPPASKPAPTSIPDNKPEVTTPPPAPPVETKPPIPRALTAKDWEGAWQLRWEYAGQWAEPTTMQISTSGDMVNGRYSIGNIRGSFVGADYARVSGVFENTAGTGVDCGGGKQGGRFSFTLAEDGKSMKGWWDVCGKGEKWQWRAARL